MKILDLFSGIGGFSIGFERAGFKTIAFCEIDQFCHKVLKKHWPTIPIYEDVSKLTKERLIEDGIDQIDIITGGFPCQDLSIAGKKEGINDGKRSGLWWQMRRIISEIRPRFAVMENVTNFISGQRGAWFGDFLRSLAEIGYDAEWRCISASEVGKAHKRERVWIIAHPNGERFNGILDKINLSKNYPQWFNDRTELHFDTFRRSFPTIPEYLRVDNGLSFELDEIKPSIKALGNSIIPEIAYLIAEQLKKYFI